MSEAYLQEVGIVYYVSVEEPSAQEVFIIELFPTYTEDVRQSQISEQTVLNIIMWYQFITLIMRLGQYFLQNSFTIKPYFEK